MIVQQGPRKWNPLCSRRSKKQSLLHFAGTRFCLGWLPLCVTGNDPRADAILLGSLPAASRHPNSLLSSCTRRRHAGSLRTSCAISSRPCPTKSTPCLETMARTSQTPLAAPVQRWRARRCGQEVSYSAAVLLRRLSPVSISNAGGQMLYDIDVGRLFWGADGDGAGARLQIAWRFSKPANSAAGIQIERQGCCSKKLNPVTCRPMRGASRPEPQWPRDTSAVLFSPATDCARC